MFRSWPNFQELSEQTMPPNHHRLTATIKGRVQGVGFRVSAMEKAINLGLTGWVRNEWNRDVQTVAEGAQENVEEYLAWLHRGPIGARVTSVTAAWGAATGEFEGFEIE